jgi:hypothetical protein
VNCSDNLLLTSSLQAVMLDHPTAARPKEHGTGELGKPAKLLSRRRQKEIYSVDIPEACQR